MRSEIAPSILSADFGILREIIIMLENAPISYIHIDVMDGHFVPNITIGPCVINSIRPYSSKIFDVHLMVEEPERHIKAFVDAGADIITIHYEATPNLYSAISMIKKSGKKAGIAINPHTPVSAVKDMLDCIDLLLIMSVNPGFAGQSFIPFSVNKLREAHSYISTGKKDVLIEVDGGINENNVVMVRDAGANIIVAGSSIFGYKNFMEKINVMVALAGGSPKHETRSP